LLLIHGAADTIIPCTESQQSHERAANSELWLLDGFGHIQAATHPEYADPSAPILRGIRIGICAERDINQNVPKNPRLVSFQSPNDSEVVGCGAGESTRVRIFGCGTLCTCS
jgi:hypothetical protein